MKKILSWMLALCMLMTMGMAAAESATYQAGTYTATSNGMQPMTVEVTFSDDAITAVTITESAETYGIGCGTPTSPVECAPAWIVENQSLAYDAVSGATISSYAIVSGVADCVKQAGGDADALKAKTIEKPAPADQTLECDVVVAGAGAAGLAAAVAAVDNGASVILLEKTGVTGGSTVRSGGYFIAAGTEMQKAQGIEDTPQMMFDFFKGVGGDALDDVKVMDFCENSAATFDWICENGAQFDSVVTVHPTQTIARVHNSLGGQFMGMGQGGQMTAPMTNSFVSKGGQLICNAAADGLVLDADGNVAGLTATMSDGSKLTVNAKAVVLATGGYGGDPEQCKRFAFMPKYSGSVSKANSGDANKIVEAVDGQVEWADYANVTMVSNTSGVGCYGEASLIVTDAGERVCNEYSYFYVYTEALIQAGSTGGWYLTDAEDPFPTAQYAMTLDSTPRAATAAELAEQIGADPAVLTATVERYNELCKAGEDADFGKPADYLNALDGDTIYAIRLDPGISGTYGGVMTDVQTRVLNNAGEVVPGLYAAGEAAFCGLVGSEYPVCGTAIGTAFYFGKVAGEGAAALAK